MSQTIIPLIMLWIGVIETILISASLLITESVYPSGRFPKSFKVTIFIFGCINIFFSSLFFTFGQTNFFVQITILFLSGVIFVSSQFKTIRNLIFFESKVNTKWKIYYLLGIFAFIDPSDCTKWKICNLLGIVLFWLFFITCFLI